MYKIVFVVVASAFIFQSAFSKDINSINSIDSINSKQSPTDPTEQLAHISTRNSSAPVISDGGTSVTVSSSKTSGKASSLETCFMLVQMSSVALVVKHLIS